jgi:ATP-dependent DNA helicase 2 subunit 2
VLFGSEQSNNALHTESAEMHENPEYQHIQSVRDPQNIDLEFFRSVQEIEAEEAEHGVDLADVMNVGVDMLVKYCKKNKFKKRLFLITDGERKQSADKDKVSDLVDRINLEDIKVNCITVDFCDTVDDKEEIVAGEQESEAQKKNRKLFVEL